MPLTDSQIRGLKPEDRPQRYSDTGGLSLLVLPSGKKQFTLRFYQDGKRKTVTLGDYPKMRLTDARTRRDEIKLRASNGEEIAPPPRKPEKPKVQPPASDTWESQARRYLAFRERQGMHYRTASKLARHIEFTIRGLGTKRIAEITAQDILDLVRPVEDEGKIESAHEIRSRCAQVFDFAEAEGVVNANPARKVVGAMVKRKRGKFPGLTDPRAIGRLMRHLQAFDQCEPQVRTGLLLSAYLFPRNDQLRGMTWDEIDFQTRLWEIPAARMKGSDAQDQLVPLPRQAVDLLEEIRPWTGRSHLVLPSPRDFSRKLSDPTFNMALRRMGYCTRTQHCHHGFRTTASTSLNEMGFNRDWIERQLAHVDQDTVRRGYNKAQYLEGRTRMMQEYADWLDAQAAAHQ